METCKKKGIDPPDYEFEELIGKGTYGRVYKCRSRQTNTVVALKMIETDKTDYKADSASRDDTINEFVRETAILQQLKDHRVKNVNLIHAALSIDIWLFIITEYCPGGSLATLMKANNRPSHPGLEEEFIIPIAREVSIALKSVHEAGIIHRDIKCANILVTEDGRLQLCDFGISNVLENEVSKRSTIIGTPHWMAPELVSHLGSDFQSVKYGAEVDNWAFGCAVYEMATGFPPNAKVQPTDLGLVLHRKAPRLEGSKYPDGLKAFVAFLLEENPNKRPTASQIADNHYIKDTDETYPTESVRALIRNYAMWEAGGGVRASLFNPYGAGGAGDQGDLSNLMSPTDDLDGEWNFSTSQEFVRRISMGLSPFNGPQEMTPFEKVMEEQRIHRGGNAMRGIFDQDQNPYGTRETGNSSDLHFRNLSNPPNKAADRMTLIDLDLVQPIFDLDGPVIDLDSAPTLKPPRNRIPSYADDSDRPPLGDPKRDTIDWTFPSMVSEAEPRKPDRLTKDWTFPAMIPEANSPDNSRTTKKLPRDSKLNNRATKDWKFPAEWSSTSNNEASEKPKPALIHTNTAPVTFGYTSSVASSPDRSSMIDLDSALYVTIPEISRPTTADSLAESAASQMTSGDPFDLEPEIYLSGSNNRGSLHIKSQSEPSAAFQNQDTNPESNQSLAPDTSSIHNRSSSVMDGTDINRNSGRISNAGFPRWNGANIYHDANNPWDPFSDEDYSPDRRQWPAQPSRRGPSSSQAAAYRRQHKRSMTSTGSGRTVGSDDSSIGASSNNMATLRPSNAYRNMGSRSTALRPPRPPNHAALVGHDRRLMEEELALMWEEMGSQAEMMMSLLAGLVVDEEGPAGLDMKENGIPVGFGD